MYLNVSFAELLPKLRLERMNAYEIHMIYLTDELTDKRKRNLVKLMQWHSNETNAEEKTSLEQQFINEIREAVNELRQNRA